MSDPQPMPADDSADALFVTVYARLKAMAARQLAGHRNATLDTTELVHELYLRMGQREALRFEHPAQFFSYAARAMRHVLLDRAIRKSRMKLGGDVAHTDILDPAAQQVATDPALALQLDSALGVLEKQDARAARTFELHYFAGLELDKVAQILGVSKRTVDRDWRFARAYLSSEMQS